LYFLAVGTQFGFDRLVKAVDEVLEQQRIHENVFAQIGPGNYMPRYMEYVISLEKDAFDQKLNSCDAIISHAGIGNISLALTFGKPLLVMPRLKRYGEAVNDHQVGTARKFEELGHILAAYSEAELVDKLAELKKYVPKKRVAQPEAVVRRIKDYLDSLG